MRKETLLSMLALLLLTGAAARAQGTSPIDEHKFEVGALYTLINLEDFGSEPISGVGGRVAYNFNEHFALDAEASFFPETKLGNDQFGQKTQAFVGVRAGARSKYVGAFVKARPGVMGIGEVTSGFSCNSTSFGQTCRPRHSNFAFDAGGVLEFYPTSRAIIRIDAGDTIVRIRNASRGFFAGPQSETDVTHNFQFSIGLGYRF